MRHPWVLTAAVSVLCLGGSGCSKSTTPPAPTQQPTTSVPTSTATGAATLSAPPVATQSAAPADDDSSAVSSEVAGKLGATGFRLKGLRGHGWTRVAPAGDVLFHVSGPPGGPLSFQVRAYSAEASGRPSLEKLFKDAVPNQAAKPGVAEKVRLAGAEREAQSFRSGAGHGVANWCLVKLPKSEGAQTGSLVLAEVGTGEKTEPKCEHSLRHAAIKPIVDSFALE